MLRYFPKNFFKVFKYEKQAIQQHSVLANNSKLKVVIFVEVTR